MSNEASRTLVLLPGLMCDAAVWQGMLREWQPTHRAVVADYGMCHDLGDMARCTLEAHPGRLDIAGHSMGGRVALEMMRQAPERVGRVALLGTGYAPLPTGAAGEAERAKRQHLIDWARRSGVREMAGEWVKGMVPAHRLNDDALITDILDMFDRKSLGHFEAQIQALLSRPDATETLRHWSGRVWVIAGELDAWANVAQHEAMVALLPQAHLEVMTGLGHMFPMENPSATAQVFMRWMREPLVNESFKSL